jgi:predicted acetyltransferase
VTTLGSVYLGGFTWAQLAQAGRVEALRDGAVHRADALFRAGRAPWCPEIF